MFYSIAIFPSALMNDFASENEDEPNILIMLSLPRENAGNNKVRDPASGSLPTHLRISFVLVLVFIKKPYSAIFKRIPRYPHMTHMCHLMTMTRIKILTL